MTDGPEPLANVRDLRLVRLHDIAEDGWSAFAPVTHAVVIARSRRGLLLVLNRATGAWELPGGSIDPGETLRACAAREFTEETGEAAPALRWRGLTELAPPTHADAGPAIQFGGLYCAELTGELRPSYQTDEIAHVGVWPLERLPRPLSAIDAELLLLFR